MEFTIKEVIYSCSLILSMSAVYWILVLRIQKLESTKDVLVEKVDSLLKSVESLKTLITEHIAFHKGKESNNG